MMNSIPNTEIMAYLGFCNLQKKYTDMYTDLELKFLDCGCIKCKIRLISFGLELGNLNALINHLEHRLTPSVAEILINLGIEYRIVDDRIII